MPLVLLSSARSSVHQSACHMQWRSFQDDLPTWTALTLVHLGHQCGRQNVRSSDRLSLCLRASSVSAVDGYLFFMSVLWVIKVSKNDWCRRTTVPGKVVALALVVKYKTIAAVGSLAIRHIHTQLVPHVSVWQLYPLISFAKTYQLWSTGFSFSLIFVVAMLSRFQDFYFCP